MPPLRLNPSAVPNNTLPQVSLCTTHVAVEPGSKIEAAKAADLQRALPGKPEEQKVVTAVLAPERSTVHLTCSP